MSSMVFSTATSMGTQPLPILTRLIRQSPSLNPPPPPAVTQSMVPKKYKYHPIKGESIPYDRLVSFTISFSAPISKHIMFGCLYPQDLWEGTTVDTKNPA